MTTSIHSLRTSRSWLILALLCAVAASPSLAQQAAPRSGPDLQDDARALADRGANPTFKVRTVALNCYARLRQAMMRVAYTTYGTLNAGVTIRLVDASNPGLPIPSSPWAVLPGNQPTFLSPPVALMPGHSYTVQTWLGGNQVSSPSYSRTLVAPECPRTYPDGPAQLDPRMQEL